MEPLGTIIKRARDGRKLSLSQAAELTRISYRHLQSIEEGRFRDLPGGMYNRAFLRAYAEFLELDPKPLLERYDSEYASQDRTAKAKVKVPQEPPRKPPSPVLVWFVMLVASVAGVFLSRQWIKQIFSPFFLRPPSAAQVAQPQAQTAPQPAASPQASPAQTSLQTAAPPVQSGSIPVSVPSPEPQPAGTAAAASAPTAAPPQPVGPSTAGTRAPTADPEKPSDRLTLHIVAEQSCWTSVTADSNRVLARELRSGDERTLDAAQEFTLVLGNAGGVRVDINGKPARPLGRSGQVLSVKITRENYTEFLQNRNP